MPVPTSTSAGKRIERLEKRLLTAPYEICMERARHFTESYRESEGEHPALRNALALKRTLERQPIHIYEDEWIVGNKTDKFLAPVLSVERGDSIRALELEVDVLEEKERPFFIDEKDRDYFLSVVLPYWSGRSLRDLKARYWEEMDVIDGTSGFFRTFQQIRDFSEFARHVGRKSLRKMGGVETLHSHGLRRGMTAWKNRGELAHNNPSMAIYCYDVQGHLCLGVDKVVREGYLGIIEKARKRIEALDQNDEEYHEKKSFLEAVIISLEAAITYADRLSQLARELSEKEEDPERKERLEQIADNLAWSPAHPAETFYQGVQATWFALLVGEIQYGMHDVLGIGRADQYLYPLYKKDMSEGNITKEEAIELLQELNLKLTANITLYPEVATDANATLGVSQHCLIIGGLDREGKDATNELSYLMLEAYEKQKGVINQLSVRVHKDTPADFLKAGVGVFRATSGHAFFNDEVIIPALVSNGCSLEDARDYNIVGCIETSTTSNCFPCPGGHEIVLPLVLYMTMTNGRHPAPLFGQKRSIATGDPEDLRTFADFMNAFKEQLRHNMQVLARATEGKDRTYMEMLPAPYVSALMDDCIEKAKDATKGGAKYDFTSFIGRGLGTTADSLMAIEKVVYEEKLVSLRELVEACLANFEGHEKLRQWIINKVPKYGDGSGEADIIAREIVSFFCDEASLYKNARGGSYRAGMYSYGNHVLDGFYTGATPDGRLRGEPTSNGISPSNSVGEGDGLTSVCSSVAQVGNQELTGGVAFNVKIHPAYLERDEGIDKMCALLSSYFSLGGMHVQPNVISDKTLREAQKNPEAYRGLVVKVAGYSAYFTDLGTSIQEDIIARYEFGT